MKSPKVKGIGEVVTEYGAKVMKIFKKGLLGRSLFDFYGDVKANAIRVKESSSVPQTPVDNDGGVVYVKNSDGKLYYKSNEVSEVEISASDTVLTTEQVQDIAGALVATGGTKTGIAVTYQDDTGDVDFVVDHNAATNYVAAEHVDWAASGAGTIHTDNYIENVVQTTVSGSSGTVTSIGNLTGDVTSSNRATTIANDAVTYAKMQNVSATNVVLGRDSAGAGVVEEISAASLREIINVEDGADVTDATNVGSAGALMDSELTDLAGVKGVTISTLQVKPSEGAFANGDKTKLDSIAANATADQTNVTGSSGSCTGNSATATALTTGNKDITGSLNVKSSSATGNPLLTFNQTTTRRAFIQLADNNASFQNHLRIASEFGPVSIAAASTAGSDTDTVFFMVEPTGTFKFGAVDSDATLTADGTMNFRIDADNNSTSKKFSFQKNGGTELASLNESGNLNVNGGIDLLGYVRPGISAIKILPSDFIPDDVGRPAQIDDGTSNKRFLKSHSTAKLYASIDIPLGFKATAVDVFGSGTSVMSVHVMSITSGSIVGTVGNGNIGTTLNFSGTSVNGSSTDYLLIELAQASTEEVFGGAVTIAKI
jgi:hypothetical protein